MGITQFLTEIGAGLGSFLPTLVQTMVDGFIALFFATGENGAITGLNAVGETSLTFFIVAMSLKIIPTIAGWLKLRASRRKRARRAK